MALPEGHVDHSRLDVGVAHRLHDGEGNWEHLNLIFPVYFDLMRQFSPISPEGAREVFLH